MEARACALTLMGRAAIVMTAQDITARKQAERELENRTAEIRQANADLQQFADIVAHDLHEPLRAITGFLELLVQRYQGRLNTHAEELIHFAVSGARRMQQLLQGL